MGIVRDFRYNYDRWLGSLSNRNIVLDMYCLVCNKIRRRHLLVVENIKITTIILIILVAGLIGRHIYLTKDCKPCGVALKIEGIGIKIQCLIEPNQAVCGCCSGCQCGQCDLPEMEENVSKIYRLRNI